MDSRLTIGFVAFLDRAMAVNGANLGIKSGDDSLTLAYGIAVKNTALFSLAIIPPPLIDCRR